MMTAVPTLDVKTRGTTRSFTENVKFPRAEGYGARIGDLWVRLAVGPDRPLRYYTKDSLAPRQDFRGNVTENVLDIGYTWARTEVNGGEGLDWDPRELSIDESQVARDRTRFWDSRNLDVEAPAAGVPYALELTRVFENWTGSASIVDPKDIGISSTNIYVADGQTMRHYSAWDSSEIAPFDIGSTISMIAVSQSNEAVVVTTNGQIWYKDPSGFTYVQLTGVATFVRAAWFVKGRFVALRRDSDGGNGELGEVVVSGTGDLVVFDTIGNDICHSVVSSGSAIVAAVSDGTIRSYVPEQGNQTDPASVNLVIRGRTDMPRGETPYVLGAEGGVLTILTVDDTSVNTPKTTRFYRAEVLSAQYDYVVGGIQLQHEWLNSKESINPQDNMSSVRNAIYFTINEEDGYSYVWRFDLVTFGLSRHNTVGQTRDAMFSTVVFEGQGAVIDQDDDNETVVRLASEDTFNPFGYMITPNITFGLNTEIGWIAAVLEAQQLSTSNYVELWRSTDPEAILDWQHPSWQQTISLTDPAQSGAEIPMLGSKSRTMAFQLRVYSGGTESPQITRTATRGIPTHRDWIVNLPVNISDIIEVPGRMPLTIPGLGDELHRSVLSLVGIPIELVVLDPPLLFRGIIDNIDEPVEFISDRGSASVYATLQFRGLRSTSTIQSVGDAGMGIGTMGIATMGIGESTEV